MHDCIGLRLIKGGSHSPHECQGCLKNSASSRQLASRVFSPILHPQCLQTNCKVNMSVKSCSSQCLIAGFKLDPMRHNVGMALVQTLMEWVLFGCG